MVTWPAIICPATQSDRGGGYIRLPFLCFKVNGFSGIAAALQIVMLLVNSAGWHDKHRGANMFLAIQISQSPHTS